MFFQSPNDRLEKSSHLRTLTSIMTEQNNTQWCLFTVEPARALRESQKCTMHPIKRAWFEGPTLPASHLCTPHEEKNKDEAKWLQCCTGDSSGTSMHILFLISPFYPLMSLFISAVLWNSDSRSQHPRVSARWSTFSYHILSLIWHIVCFRSAGEGKEECMWGRERESGL